MPIEKVFAGSLPSILRNDDGLYEGDLTGYFRILIKKARNLGNPYHNFRHLMHVVYLCYQACLFYQGQFSRRNMRNLLVAAMFHDFDHRGRREPDSDQIERAVTAFREHVTEEDRGDTDAIIELIRLTEFPYQTPTEEIPLEAQILRDADLSQAMSIAWIQQVIFGLAAEWEQTPVKLLEMQKSFIGNLRLATEWAREMFPEKVIRAKIREAEELLEIINDS